MKKPSRLAYAYAVGRVRALERKLVARAVFSEASEEGNFASAMKIIFDAGDFKEEMVEIRNSDDLDTLIEEEEEDLYQLMRELLLEKDMFRIIIEESRPEKAGPLAVGLGNVFIEDYLRNKIDLANLKILARAKYSGLASEAYGKLVLKGGFLDERFFLQNYELPFPEIGEKLQSSAYIDLWNRAVDALEENETFVELERGIEDFLMAYLRRAKYIVFGPEPVLAYGLAKKRELSLVRLVGVGKLNRIPVELLKQRISETYV